MDRTNSPGADLGRLKRTVLARLVQAAAILGLLIFLPAGTLRFWQAWVYLATLLVPMAFVLRYLLAHNPELLARRMRFREKEAQQKRVLTLAYPIYLAAYLLPGFHQRFGWAPLPVWLVVMADLVVFLGYLLTIRVFRENAYASRIVEVEQAQQVITTGPYATVRHPMYVGVLLIFVFSPLALGSHWGMLPALLLVPIIMARIRNEEAVLLRELKGYEQYTRRTRYRLVPGIW